MALRDERAVRQARVIAIAWAVIIYSGMLALGLAGRVLYAGLADAEQVLFEAANRLISPVLAGVMIAAVLSAIMSTADSQLLVAGSSVSHDLAGASRREYQSLARSRWVVMMISTLAVALALAVPDTIFNRVLFAWHAIGSALGPPLVLALLRVRLTGRGLFRAMLAGFSLTVLLHWLPNLPDPGDAMERLLPLLVSGFIAYTQRDRGKET
jgi:sodium/proline symporter